MRIQVTFDVSDPHAQAAFWAQGLGQEFCVHRQTGPPYDLSMRVFLAGAGGVIGRRLVPLLGEAGHQVVGTTRSPTKAEELRRLGAAPVVVDVYDLPALTEAVRSSGAEMVMHQLTDLPDRLELIPAQADRNARIRTEGTRNLLQAAGSAGIVRFVAQSIAWTPTSGGTSVAEHERLILDAGGVVLRYGQFYGPGTYYPDTLPDPPRVHIDQAASRTVELLDSPTGVITILD